MWLPPHLELLLLNLEVAFPNSSFGRGTCLCHLQLSPHLPGVNPNLRHSTDPDWHPAPKTRLYPTFNL